MDFVIELLMMFYQNAFRQAYFLKHYTYKYICIIFMWKILYLQY